MSGTASRNTNTNIKFIYDLPYEVHQKLGLLLDPNDKWKELGGIHMGFNVYDLDRVGKAFLRKESPTEDLLTKWGNNNHTVLDLFIIMYKMQHSQAMKVLQPYVDEKYHCLIFEGVSRMEIDLLADRLKTLIELDTTTSRTPNPNQIPVRPVGNQPLDNQRSPNNSERSRGALDISELGSGLPFIEYEQLKEGTKNWHRSNFLGRGGFGVVFRGVIKQTPMAIKRLEPQKGNELEFNALEAQRQQLFRELKYLNNNRHDNVLPLYGYSFGEDKYCLVYQFMPNGSLEDRIQCRLGTPPLQWYVRYNIARGTARGIQFLHSRDKPLVHGDIKSANILLDQCMEPKIGDFGLAREGPTENYTHVKVSRVHGTRPYLPDEFLRGKKFSTKVDTYSFGVVLFEIATGLRAYDEGRKEKFLRDYIYNYPEEKLQEVIDPKIGPDNIPLFKMMIEQGKKCVVQRPKARPEMTDVSLELDKTLGDIDSLLRASYQRMTQSRFDPTVRRQSLIPATGSFHPEPWIYATPPASIPVSIQPPAPTRQSPSPTKPADTVPSLPEVSEEKIIEDVSHANFEFRIPTVEPSVPNFQGVPNIVFTPPDKSITNAKSSARQTTSSSSSVSDSDSSSYSDESSEQKPVHIRSEIEMNNSDSFLPMVSLLQRRAE